MTSEARRKERLRQIDDLTQQVIRSEIFFDLWWRQAGEERRHYLEGMNLHSGFFRFAPHACLLAAIVQLMMPFDRARGSLSLKTLLGKMDQTDQVKSAAKAIIERDIATAKPVIAKVKLLRDECFAHRTPNMSYDDVFRKAAIKPREIKELIHTAFNAINRLRHAESMSLADHQTEPGESLGELLTHLQNEAAEQISS